MINWTYLYLGALLFSASTDCGPGARLTYKRRYLSPCTRRFQPLKRTVAHEGARSERQSRRARYSVPSVNYWEVQGRDEYHGSNGASTCKGHGCRRAKQTAWPGEGRGGPPSQTRWGGCWNGEGCGGGEGLENGLGVHVDPLSKAGQQRAKLAKWKAYMTMRRRKSSRVHQTRTTKIQEAAVVGKQPTSAVYGKAERCLVALQGRVRWRRQRAVGRRTTKCRKESDGRGSHGERWGSHASLRSQHSPLAVSTGRVTDRGLWVVVLDWTLPACTDYRTRESPPTTLPSTRYVDEQKWTKSRSARPGEQMGTCGMLSVERAGQERARDADPSGRDPSHHDNPSVFRAGP